MPSKSTDFRVSLDQVLDLEPIENNSKAYPISEAKLVLLDTLGE